MSDLIAFIRNEFDPAWDTGIADNVVARFADDGVAQTVPPLPGAPERFVGKAEIRGFVQMLIPHFHVDSKDYQQNGDRVTWFARVSSDSIRQMGVDALDTNCEAIIRDGKVVSFKAAFTPETLAALKAAQKA